jgi:hypothetical protein
MGVTSGAGTAYPYVASEFNTVIVGLVTHVKYLVVNHEGGNDGNVYLWSPVTAIL